LGIAISEWQLHTNQEAGMLKRGRPSAGVRFAKIPFDRLMVASALLGYSQEGVFSRQ
jgi:hypothetical protein